MGVYGAADSTLVNMAYRAEMANVPLDQTAIFAAREENLKEFTNNISNLFENQYKDHKKTEKDIVDLGQKAEDVLLGGGNVNEFQMETHYNTVTGYKDRLDAIKIDDTLDERQKERARDSLMLEMNKYKNSIADQGETMQGMINNSANGRLFSTMDGDEAKLWKGILADYVDGTNTCPETIENGEKFYAMTVPKDGGGTKKVKMSLREIREGLAAHDPEVQLAFGEKINDTLGKFSDAQKNGIDISEKQMVVMKNDLMSSVGNSWSDVMNIANGKFGDQAFSFEEVLHGQAKTMGLNGHAMIDNSAIELIHNELDKLGTRMGGTSAIDMNNDGEYDQTDIDMYHMKDAATSSTGINYNTPENAKKMIELVKKDKHLYKELVVNYTMATAVSGMWAQQTQAAVDATLVQAQQNADKQDLSVEEYERKQEIATREAIEQKQTPTYAQDLSAKETKAIVTKANKAISTGNFSALSGLDKGFVKSDKDGKLFYVDDGRKVKNKKGVYKTIDIAERDENGNVKKDKNGNIILKDLKTDKDVQDKIMSYVTGSAMSSYDPLNPE